MEKQGKGNAGLSAKQKFFDYFEHVILKRGPLNEAIILAFSGDGFYTIHMYPNELSDDFLKAINRIFIAEGVTHVYYAFPGCIGEWKRNVESFVVVEPVEGDGCPIRQYNVVRGHHEMMAGWIPQEEESVDLDSNLNLLRPSEMDLKQAYEILKLAKQNDKKFIILGFDQVNAA